MDATLALHAGWVKEAVLGVLAVAGLLAFAIAWVRAR